MPTKSLAFGLLTLVLASIPSNVALAQMPDPPGQVAAGQKPVHEAYLFAHMKHRDYGSLYYSVSTDGLHWRELNGGKVVFTDYHGHADIDQGPDGRYYLVGNRNDEVADLDFWVSDDLVQWERFGKYVPDLTKVPNYPKAMHRIGAAKMFYDDAGKQWVVTWHTTHDLGPTTLPEPYWAGQRTLYATSPDLKTFSDPPRKLFNDWDMATIDTILVKQGDTYYAILKDERYPTPDWPTGKTVRISKSTGLTGPWTEPSAPISPNFREAPTVIPSPDGKAWYAYYEQYPGIGYGLSVALTLDGPWYQVAGNMNYGDWDKYKLPPRVRHGTMLPISRQRYDALIATFGDAPVQPTTAPR
ncbi:MAG: hypothetical protein QM770_21320 [Tepidisphaeraceae bacterium]